MNFPKQISRILFRMASTCGVKIPPPRALFTPLTVPQKLLLGPGPANASPRILGASALPLLGHLHPEFVTIMDEVKAGLKYAFQTRNEWTLAISGTGHAGMEAAILNLVERGDVVLVCVNGIWGERASALAERLGKFFLYFFCQTLSTCSLCSTWALFRHREMAVDGLLLLCDLSLCFCPKIAFSSRMYL